MKKLFLFSLLSHSIFYIIFTISFSLYSATHEKEEYLKGQIIVLNEKNEMKPLPSFFKKNSSSANVRKSASKQSRVKTANNHLDEKIHNQLSKILHEAIAKNQTYPEAALSLQQMGQVQIAFTLFPDGHLEQITIKKSSGFRYLDLAAMESVKSIAPVHEAKQYLSKKETFKVQIIYD